MISLIFDTETTTLPNKELAPDEPGQARIMQLAMLLTDENNKELAVYKSLILPSDWGPVHPKAYEHHKLTVEQCDKLGTPILHALTTFSMFYELCDVAVAFNKDFDIQLLEIEYLRHATIRPQHKPYHCAMKPLTMLIGLKQEGTNRPKWPKLSEAYTYCTGKTLENAHDALADVRATGQVWNYIVNSKIVNVNC